MGILAGGRPPTASSGKETGVMGPCRCCKHKTTSPAPSPAIPKHSADSGRVAALRLPEGQDLLVWPRSQARYQRRSWGELLLSEGEHRGVVGLCRACSPLLLRSVCVTGVLFPEEYFNPRSIQIQSMSLVLKRASGVLLSCEVRVSASQCSGVGSVIATRCGEGEPFTKEPTVG